MGLTRCDALGDCDIRAVDVSVPAAQLSIEAGRSGRWRVRALDAAGYPGEWSDWNDLEYPQREE